jgi:hypothetical protein
MIKTREIYVNGQLSNTEQYDDGLTAEMHLSAYYFEKLNGGITVNGVFIATGPEDRNLIGGAVTRAVVQNNDALAHPYYPTGGGSVSLTNAQYKTLGLAIAEHVQKCLDAEATVQAAIGNYTTEQQIKDAFDAAYSA